MMLPLRDAPKRRTSVTVRVKRAGTVLPVAVLSIAWTASLTGSGVAATVAAPTVPVPAVSPGPSIPSDAIQAPASVSSPDQGSPTYTGKDAQQIVSTSSADQIPSAALAAYQRAESVIDAADTSCHLTWQLIAAIGRVESNHGRSNGSTLDNSGIAHPAIYGVRLKMADTDAGLIDGQKTYDRAVGPMQFIPATWQAVAVDADNDGIRNPQDINDAALGAAVYLCSGPGDLSTTAGQRAAVHRYNHSTSYVNLVLAIMDSYLDGDFLASPNDTLAGGYLTPLPPMPQRHHAGGGKPNHAPAGAPVSVPTAAPTQTSGPTTTPASNPAPTQHPSPGLPGIPGLPVPHPTLPALPTTHIKPVDHLLTQVQATLQCTLDGYVNNILSAHDPFDACLTAYTTTGKPPRKLG